jgi:hypothetical protein
MRGKRIAATVGAMLPSLESATPAALRLDVADVAADIEKTGNFTAENCDVEVRVLRILDGNPPPTLPRASRDGRAAAVGRVYIAE